MAINVEQVFGTRYKDASLSKLLFSEKNNNDIMAWVHKKPVTSKNLLFVHGNPGSGKTYFAAAMVNFLNGLKENMTYRYLTDYEFISHLRNKMSEGHETIREVVRLSESATLFILDDLGSIRMTDWEHEQIHALIDHRYRFLLPTLVISNLNKRDINEKFESRFISRVFAAENTIVEIVSADLRREGY